jgi:peroxiredoxin
MRFATMCLAVAAVALLVSGAVSAQDDQGRVQGIEKEKLLERGLKVGTKAPDFEVKDLHGNTVTLADFAGKYLVLVFWATTGDEPKMLVQKLGEYADYFETTQDLELFGIAAQMAPADVPKFLEAQELTWFKTGYTKDAALVRAYEATRLPMTYVIDPGGTIIGVFPNYSSKKVDDILAFLMEQGIGPKVDDTGQTGGAENATKESAARDPEAVALFQKMCDKYKTAQTMSFTSETTFTWEGEQPGQQSRKVTAVLKKPNLVSADIEVDSEKLGRVVSDGAHLSEYYTQQNEYMTIPAPADISTASESRLLRFVSNLFFEKDPLDAVLGGAEKMSFEGSAATPDGKECRVVQQDLGPRGVYKIFFDDSTGLVVRVEGDIKGAAAGGQDIKMVEVRSSELDPALAADAFEFVPPEGAKQVEMVPAPKIIEDEPSQGGSDKEEDQ